MAGIDGGTGVAGSTFTHYDYPGIYQPQDFHHCGTAGDEILTYANRTQVQTCELSNLADLATETEYVRGRLAQYANDLLTLGVDGLRLDAAKHIASEDIDNILSRLTSKPYITQEVIFGAGEAVQPSEYTANGFSLPEGIGTCSATGGSGGWLCQHRYIAISGMVGFRNNVGSAEMTDWVSPQPQQIAFGRGK
ncbi:hypothetical protein C0992_009836 [Termitomyces sp. T32_za158]|nr:hypothetical protein C0992_009836 [Termitomyces sp. T32_za158]